MRSLQQLSWQLFAMGKAENPTVIGNQRIPVKNTLG